MIIHNEEDAKVALIGILDLDGDATWDDVIAYAAKMRGSNRMASSTIKRRSAQLAALLRWEDDRWPELLRAVHVMLRRGEHYEEQLMNHVPREMWDGLGISEFEEFDGQNELLDKIMER